MIKLTIILDTRKSNLQGLFPIKLRVSNNNTSTTISTGCFCTPQTFTGKADQAITKSVPFADEQNNKIKQLYLDYANAINKLDYEGKSHYSSAAVIKDRIEQIRKKESAQEITFSAEIGAYIKMIDKPKTAYSYQYSYDRIHEFMGKKTIYFDEITYEMLDKFERWMSSKSLSINTRGIVFRNIRTIFNYAINTNKIDYSLYPFRKFKIKKAKKEKEFLSAEDIMTIANLKLNGQRLNQARDFFLLSFLLCGINPIDLYNLRAPARDKVTFTRQKISHKEPEPVHLFIEEPMKEIINMYKGEKHLLRFAEKHNYTTFKSRIGKDLKVIGDMIGKNLYLYMARYSWSTIAAQIGIPHDIISKALGHTDNTTAEKYYISFDWNKVKEANKKVINHIFANRT